MRLISDFEIKETPSEIRPAYSLNALFPHVRFSLRSAALESVVYVSRVAQKFAYMNHFLYFTLSCQSIVFVAKA